MQEKISICPRCFSPAHGHGTRKRHVIRNGEKCWYRVQRGLCIGKCRRSFTMLLPFMLPDKHYSGPEIEEALSDFEEGVVVNRVETGAEESTLRRWKRQFRSTIPILTTKIEALVQCWFQKTLPLSTTDSPLGRLKKALELVEVFPSGWTILAWSFFQALAHPLCLG